ncbi:MAG: SO_0444 family Cu/Zn efflux transporter [Candidatus Thiodiazotropha sp.]
MTLLNHLLDLYLEAAPWLLLGLVMAGLLKAWLPEGMLQRRLGEGRFLPILKASLIGAPLPLCSCGVLPAAMGLRRAGASKSATVSFMISTPETGPDSIALTYALLGPFMAVLRPVAAIASALFTGLLNALFVSQQEHRGTQLPVMTLSAGPDCGCDAGDCCSSGKARDGYGFWRRGIGGLRYAFHDIFDDIWPWLFAGLLLAALVEQYLPPESLAGWGGGLPAMLMMLVIGIPMYICATASTPLAAAMMLAGVSPGTVLVFLLAGPATNLATMGVLRREMGNRTLGLYLAGIALSSILLGVLTDMLVQRLAIPIAVTDAAPAGGHVAWIAWASGFVLIAFAASSLGRRISRRWRSHAAGAV